MLEWYAILKFLHVSFAIIWLGGALIMVILGVAADRAKNDAELVNTVLKVAWSAERIYVPASVATLIFGLLTTWLGGYWQQLWVILGLLGIIATIGLGVGVLTPRAAKVKKGVEAGGNSPAVLALCREILTIAKFDMVLLFTVVADMVLKPQLGDWITVIVFLVVIAAAGYAFLAPVLRPKTA